MRSFYFSKKKNSTQNFYCLFSANKESLSVLEINLVSYFENLEYNPIYSIKAITPIFVCSFVQNLSI